MPIKAIPVTILQAILVAANLGISGYSRASLGIVNFRLRYFPPAGYAIALDPPQPSDTNWRSLSYFPGTQRA